MKGSYILLIELKDKKNIQIGKLGQFIFKNGFYVYIGSALNGLEIRIKRHFRSKKKRHWHIDYLLDFAKIIDVYYKINENKEEYTIAKIISEQLVPVPHFGSSDCKCKTHLFFGDFDKIINILNNLDISKYKINEKT
jgi:Uri superfamily endonuclease